MKTTLAAILFTFCLLVRAGADDVLWFGAMHKESGMGEDVVIELAPLAGQASEFLLAPVLEISSKRRKIHVGMESVFRLETAQQPTLAFEVTAREPGAYLLNITFLLAEQVLFEAELRLARNQPVYFLLPSGPSGENNFFLLLR
jgi:hypothetical protein